MRSALRIGCLGRLSAGDYHRYYRYCTEHNKANSQGFDKHADRLLFKIWLVGQITRQSRLLNWLNLTIFFYIFSTISI